jgi:hypothetical protein
MSSWPIVLKASQRQTPYKNIFPGLVGCMAPTALNCLSNPVPELGSNEGLAVDHDMEQQGTAYGRCCQAQASLLPRVFTLESCFVEGSTLYFTEVYSPFTRDATDTA